MVVADVTSACWLPLIRSSGAYYSPSSYNHIFFAFVRRARSQFNTAGQSIDICRTARDALFDPFLIKDNQRYPR